MSVTYTRKGGRTVELFLPFDFHGVKYEQVEFGPIRFDHTIRWKEGKIPTILALMAEVAGITEDAVRHIAYPDADRVMAVFVDMLPPEIRDTMGRVLIEPEPEFPADEAAATPNPEVTQEPPPSNGKAPFPHPYPQPDEHGLGVDLG